MPRLNAAILLAVLAARSAAAAAKPPPKDAPLAIVGGGISGLFLASLLADAGYDDITVFEAADRIAPISCTAMVGDNPYDCSIVGVFPDAPNSTMQNLMAKAGVTWEPVTSNLLYFESATGEPTTGGWTGVLASLSKAEKADAQEEMLRWLEMAAEMRTQPSTPYGTIRSGVVLSNESFAEWAERTDMKYMLQLATPLFYTYGYSDVGLVPAALVVNYLSPLAFDALYELGMRPDTPGLPKDLAAVLSGCGKGGGPMPDCIPSMHPRQGMRAFFEGLEKSLPGSVNVRKSTPVTRIMPLPGGGARLSYDASAQFGEEEFEAVVVAVRPSAALQMLPPDHPATSLYAGYFTGLHPELRWQLYNFMVWEMDTAAPEEGTLGGELLAEDGATPFTAGFEPYRWEQQVNGTVRSAFYPWAGGKGMSAIAFVDTALVPDMSATVASNTALLKGLGFPLQRVVDAGTWRPMYPDTLRMEVQRGRDVYTSFEELQGEGGIFFTGEFINGLSVTLQAEGVDALVGAHFA